LGKIKARYRSTSNPQRLYEIPRKGKLDEEYTRYLDRIEAAAFREFGRRVPTAEDFLKVALKLRVNDLDKLKFMSAVLTRPTIMLNTFRGYRNRRETILSKLEDRYRAVFSRWITDRLSIFDRDYSDPFERIHAIKMWVSNYPNSDSFNGRLRRDIKSSANLHISSIEILNRPVNREFLSGTRHHGTASDNETKGLETETELPRIEWIGPINHVVHLFDILHRYELISPDSFRQYVKLIQGHFLVRANDELMEFNKRTLEEAKREYRKYSTDGPRGSENWSEAIRKLAAKKD
jgi:hypothetical protein